MILPFALLLVAQSSATADCLDERDYRAIELHPDQPRQNHGKGLWIGGIPFAARDVSVIEVEQEGHLDDYWSVRIRFTPEGNAKFIAAQRCGVNLPIEISIDGKLLSRPVLNEPILGGEMLLSGGEIGRAAADEKADRLRRALAMAKQP